MKYKISVTIPNDLTSLTLADVVPEIARAEQKLEAAKSALADAKAQCLAMSSAIEGFRRDIAKGLARPSDLQAATDQQRTTALSVAGYEQRVIEAERTLEATRVRGRERFRDEALARYNTLARAAEEVAPLLERLRDAEAALDAVIQRETSWTDAHGISRHLPPTPGLEWPQTLRDQSAMNSWMNTANTPSPMVTPAPVQQLAAVRSPDYLDTLRRQNRPVVAAAPAAAVRADERLEYDRHGPTMLTRQLVNRASLMSRRKQLLRQCEQIRVAGFNDENRVTFGEALDEVEAIDKQLKAAVSG